MSYPEPSPPTGSAQIALIDWLSFSIRPPEGPLAEGTLFEWIDAFLFQLFGIGQDSWQPTGKGWFGYASRINLGQFGLLAYGGERQRGTVHFELNAHACERVTNWKAVRDWGESHTAWITRCDLAHDDFTGQRINILWILNEYANGGFTMAGRPPKAQLIDDLGSNAGKTFYVGKRQHGKLTRGYEKGKQLGKPDDPWFRIEVELHNKGRDLPWEILTEPSRYFAGAYPCLAEFNAEQSRIATKKRTFELTYDRMEGWLNSAAGKSLNVMLTVHGGDAVEVMGRVVRPGMPKRLVGFTREECSRFEGIP